MAAIVNQLMEALPRRDKARLLGACEPVELLLSAPVYVRGKATSHVYFPTASFVSLVCTLDDHPGLEVGIVGNEGVVGVELMLGLDNSPFDALVQGPGEAWRIGARGFRTEIEHSLPLRRLLSRYVHVRMEQLARSACCQRFHEVAPRLARWLLASQDRAHGGRFLMTQQFLARMLGVRRSGVSTAAAVLQRDGLIRYSRGELTVLDRNGLEMVACSCYAADRRTYRESLP
jgi:CRP-like cAMP-binding protein